MGIHSTLMVWGRRLLAVLLAGWLGISGVGCAKPTEPEPLISQPGEEPHRLASDLAEVSPPQAIQTLGQLSDAYTPQVRILSPRPEEVINDTEVSVRFQVRGLPIYKDEQWQLGPHLHVFLDNEPYQAVYDLSEPLVFEDLAPGTHTLRVFASRPWHESFKNTGAFDQRTFHVFARTPQKELQSNQPLLTYSRPQGTYGAEPIMLDFYLTNAPLHLIAEEDRQDEIADWRIRCTINGQSFVFDQWQPIYLQGFKPGRNWVQLELLNDAGELIPNVFNNTVRVIEYTPGGEDILAKLMRAELSAVQVASIIDPSYEPPAEPSAPEDGANEESADTDEIKSEAEPETTESETTESETTEPEAVKTTEPETTEPETTEPETTEPETTEPDEPEAVKTTEPEVTPTAAPPLKEEPQATEAEPEAAQSQTTEPDSTDTQAAETDTTEAAEAKKAKPETPPDAENAAVPSSPPTTPDAPTEAVPDEAALEPPAAEDEADSEENFSETEAGSRPLPESNSGSQALPQPEPEQETRGLFNRFRRRQSAPESASPTDAKPPVEERAPRLPEASAQEPAQEVPPEVPSDVPPDATLPEIVEPESPAAEDDLDLDTLLQEERETPQTETDSPSSEPRVPPETEPLDEPDSPTADLEQPII